MKNFFSYFIVTIFFLLSSFCGKKGSLLPPIIKTPQEVKTFEAVQRGNKIILEWVNPKSYVDGSPLTKISEIEIWFVERKSESAGKEESVQKKKLSKKEFEKQAKLVSSIKKEKISEYRIKTSKKSPRLRYYFGLSGEDFFSKKFIFSLRIIDIKKRKSDFSDLLTVKPMVCPLPPQNLRFTVFENKIEIEWDPPQKNIDQSSAPKIEGYNVYRGKEEAETRRLNSSLIKEQKYDDEDFIFKKTYHYFVRASATDSSPYLESDDSEILEVTAKDKFPPVSPAGLVSMSGKNYITLSWDENQEGDLAGYRVWRKKEGEEEYILLTPKPIEGNTFNDTKVEKNKRYYYSITAQDIYGNESPKSEAVSEILKEGNL